jgi:hypothetical protein
VTPTARTLRQRLRQRLPGWLTDPVPRDHRETDEAFHRRRRIVAGVSLAGAGLLGVSLSTEPDSREFYGLTFAVAGTWLLGGLASGPLHLGWMARGDALRRPVATPILTGVAAFGAFYAAALVAREIPWLERPLASIVEYAKQGNDPLVLLTTLANGAAEEVFFRGAMFAAVGAEHPVIRSTAIYTLATTATRNPALVLASAVMGALWGQQRRVSGGIQAPVLTHLTWGALMLRYLPPLFRRAAPDTA